MDLSEIKEVVVCQSAYIHQVKRFGAVVKFISIICAAT